MLRCRMPVDALRSIYSFVAKKRRVAPQTPAAFPEQEAWRLRRCLPEYRGKTENDHRVARL